jgi:hypothetical protein
VCKICAGHKWRIFTYEMRFCAVLNSISGLLFLYSWPVAGDNFASKIADCKIMNKFLHSTPNYGILKERRCSLTMKILQSQAQ